MNSNNSIQDVSWGDSRDETKEILGGIGFHEKSEWKNAPAVFDEHTLRIFGLPVMEDWEVPYMEELAKIVTSKGGVILELGYGMGISATFIQKVAISKHIIVEANHDVAEKAREFGKTVTYPVEVLEGFWEEVIDQVPDGSVDGIIFDTFPLSELEVHKNHFFFFETAYKKLKTGGVFTYYSDEIDSYHPMHLEKLMAAGFKKENIDGTVIAVKPPANCQYWQSERMLAPIVIK
jgi:guanidinoacetate N-methyltransferase